MYNKINFNSTRHFEEKALTAGPPSPETENEGSHANSGGYHRY